MGASAARVKKVIIGSGTDKLPASSASLSRGGDLLDDTQLGQSDAYRSRIAGLRDASIQASGDYDPADAAITALEDAWASGTAVTAKYLPNGTNGMSGSFLVESFECSGEVAGKEQFSVTLQIDGPLSAV
jgi:predicted secreted protein